MELRTLRYFLAVAKEENMTGAAAALHISQPALSYQIAELERELNKTLFLRTGRKMVLTEDGMFLRSRAQEIIALADQTAADMQDNTQDLYGDIYIGAAESISMHFLAEIIAAFRKEYPHVVFHLYSGIIDDVLEKLNRGTVDFAVVVEPFRMDRCEILPLPLQDRLGILVCPDHPLAHRVSISGEDLYDTPLILTTRENMNEQAIAEMLKIPEEHFQVAATGNLIFNLAILASHDIGAIVTLEGLVNEASGLVFVPLDPPRSRSLGFAYKQYRPLSKAAHLFLEAVQKACADAEHRLRHAVMPESVISKTKEM